MYRKIISRYTGKCAKCGNAIYAGDSIYWQKGSRSVFHVHCFGTEPTPIPAPPVKLAKPIEQKPGAYDSQIGIAELKKHYAQLLKGDTSFFKQDYHRQLVLQSEMPGNPTSWSGFTKEQVADWIAHGFKSQAFRDLHEFSPPMRKRRKMIYGEEGELQLDLAYSGFDYPFLQWTKRETAPGLSIDIETSFSANTKANVIADFQKWLARMLYTLETEGIDLDINVANVVREGIYNYHGQTTVRVNVKKEQEATDFARWSVMFSPAGFRGFMFLAKMIGADSQGMRINEHFGYPVGEAWDLIFNPETRKLRVTCAKRDNVFPADEMSEKLRTIITQFH